jgi:hypothetical protein
MDPAEPAEAGDAGPLWEGGAPDSFGLDPPSEGDGFDLGGESFAFDFPGVPDITHDLDELSLAPALGGGGGGGGGWLPGVGPLDQGGASTSAAAGPGADEGDPLAALEAAIEEDKPK